MSTDWLLDTLWGIAYLAEALLLYYWLYHIYIQCRRRKHGQQTEAYVIQSHYQQGSYSADFGYIHDVTDTMLPEYIRKSLKSFTDDPTSSIPKPIIDICLEYIDPESLIIYYGPYEIQRHAISYHMYDQIAIPTRTGPSGPVSAETQKLDIIYDPIDPLNARPKDLGFTWEEAGSHICFAICLIIVGGVCIWGTSWSLEKHDNESRTWILSVAIAAAVIITAIVIWIRYCVRSFYLRNIVFGASGPYVISSADFEEKFYEEIIRRRLADAGFSSDQIQRAFERYYQDYEYAYDQDWRSKGKVVLDIAKKVQRDDDYKNGVVRIGGIPTSAHL